MILMQLPEWSLPSSMRMGCRDALILKVILTIFQCLLIVRHLQAGLEMPKEPISASMER